MERNLDIDNFERLLKDRSDEFKMYPEKRVWHSIYNNIHPGKKWPSVAMSITLIAILFLTGYLNTGNKNNNNHRGTQQASSSGAGNSYSSLLEKNSANLKNNSTEITSPLTEKDAVNFSGNVVKNDASQPPTLSFPVIQKAALAVNNPALKGQTWTVADNVAMPLSPVIGLAKSEFAGIATIKNDLVFTTTPRSDNSSFADNHQSKLNTTALITSNSKFTLNEDRNNEKTNPISDNVTTAESTAPEVEGAAIAANNDDTGDKLLLSDEDKAWVENYAMYNRPAPKKWAGKLIRQTYITPSVVYRQLKNAITTSAAFTNSDVIQHPSYGLEVGTGILYSLSKSVKLKAALQLNYTRYNSDAFTNSHPVATSITLVAEESGQPYPAYRSTSYSNVDGITAVKLHNETFQLSLPMGMDFKIAGNENLQWNIGATIQPTYLIGGKSFLLSSDKRNYVEDNSLLNHWNVNAGFETFVSYKTDNGITFQFGPQFRQQLFNTNRQYIIQEKLNNYGFKFGITKRIK